jgi:hypothetical protein
MLLKKIINFKHITYITFLKLIIALLLFFSVK